MSKTTTKYTTMTDAIRIALCRHKMMNPSLKHSELQHWLKAEHNVDVSQPTISQTLKRTANLLGLGDDVKADQKRQRVVKYPDMEKALAQWFHTNQGHVSMSGNLIKENAQKILDKLHPGHDPFVFSNGWLDGFKNRHGIRTVRRFGESGVIRNPLPKIRQVLDTYAWSDIYNMDETGLFYRMQADNVLATKQLEGRKQSRERLTLAICCNGDGSDKLPLWVIGKYPNPRCFKNINRRMLGCQYRASKKAWMTQTIFLEWLRAFDRHVANRKVLLILDNCSTHVPLSELATHIELQNTTVFYLPSNMTSKMKIQPCDAGIICNLKAYYRSRFNRLLLQHLEDGIQDAEKIDILQAIRMAVSAWSTDVKPAMVFNCFLHCQIRTPGAHEQVPTAADLVDQAVVGELQAQIAELPYHNPMAVGTLLDYPEEINFSYTSTLEEFIEENRPKVAYENLEDDEEDDSQEVAQITAKEAGNMIESLITFWLQQDELNEDFIVSLSLMQNKVAKLRSHQMAQRGIRDVFPPD